MLSVLALGGGCVGWTGKLARWVSWVVSELSWLLKASLVACKFDVPEL
jgi:hypothetical protein